MSKMQEHDAAAKSESKSEKKDQRTPIEKSLDDCMDSLRKISEGVTASGGQQLAMQTLGRVTEYLQGDQRLSRKYRLVEDDGADEALDS